MASHDKLKGMITKACPFIRPESLYYSECGKSALITEHPVTVGFNLVGGDLDIEYMDVWGWSPATPQDVADMLHIEGVF